MIPWGEGHSGKWGVTELWHRTIPARIIVVMALWLKFLVFFTKENRLLCPFRPVRVRRHNPTCPASSVSVHAPSFLGGLPGTTLARAAPGPTKSHAWAISILLTASLSVKVYFSENYCTVNLRTLEFKMLQLLINL
jgi:hypothetical protein